MKAVFLDYASLDKNDLDFQALHAVFDELILYPSTDAERFHSYKVRSCSFHTA